MIRPTLVLLLSLLTAAAVHPWGFQGHAAIGLVAQQRLTPETRRHVEAVLGNDDLSAIANWMDQLRSATAGYGSLASNPEARRFAAKFPKNEEWHFVDIPLAEKAYSPTDTFSRPDDVVHQIGIALDVLEGRNTAISQRIALFMLVHFVGDLHQPLHVACGYYDLSDLAHPRLLTAPAAAKGHESDKGANALFFGPGKYDELHGYWDFTLPQKVAGGRSIPALAKKLMNDVPAAAAATPGDYHRWAQRWATESIAASRDIVYAGIRFGAAELSEKGDIHKIHIVLPDGYDARAIPEAEQRLAFAGYRLAALLESLHWAPPPPPAPAVSPDTPYSG